MQTYIYTARDIKTARKVSAEIEADNEAAAAHLLASRGLAPLEISLKVKQTGVLGHWRNRIPNKEKVIFSRQLSTLVNAGLPLVQSLNSVREQTGNKPLKGIISRVITEVEGGATLSEALSHHPDIFDTIYVSLIAAGETSGTLDKSLERLAVQQEKDSEIISKVRGALVYPMIVILVLFAVVIFMLTTVLPSVQSLYEGIPGAELPFVTQLLLDVSGLMRQFWWLLVIAAGGGVIYFRHYVRTSPGRAQFDHLKLRLPAIGALYEKM